MFYLKSANCHTSESRQEHLGVLNEDPIDLQFNHSGYLFLASESVAHIMEENYSTQRYQAQETSANTTVKTHSV